MKIHNCQDVRRLDLTQASCCPGCHENYAVFSRDNSDGFDLHRNTLTNGKVVRVCCTVHNDLIDRGYLRFGMPPAAGAGDAGARGGKDG